MGSDLNLTGLASGFDWQPLVEKLIELESVPKQRLEAEKARNNEKVSELGILKSQLDTLNGAATALQNKICLTPVPLGFPHPRHRASLQPPKRIH